MNYNTWIDRHCLTVVRFEIAVYTVMVFWRAFRHPPCNSQPFFRVTSRHLSATVMSVSSCSEIGS